MKDIEFHAMRQIKKQLDGLDSTQSRQRVIRWVVDRLNEESNAHIVRDANPDREPELPREPVNAVS